MSYYGRQVLAHFEWAEAEIAFWTRWGDQLHPDERQALVRGDIGIIKRPLEPEWPALEWMEVASNFWIKPHQPTFTHRGYRIRFDVRDFRARLPRHVPQVFDPPETDAFGVPVKHRAGAIARATEDGNYTSSHELAVPGVDDEPNDFIARRLQKEAKDREAQERREFYVAMSKVESSLTERMRSEPSAVGELRRARTQIRRIMERTKAEIRSLDLAA